jgi:hypothetical protein
MLTARLKTGITLRSFARCTNWTRRLWRVERGIQYVPPYRRLRWPSPCSSAWTISATRAAGRSWLSGRFRLDCRAQPLGYSR